MVCASPSSININSNNNNNNNTTNNITLVYAGSDEERHSLTALLRQPATQQELANLPAHEIPGALLRLWKGVDAPAELKNIQVQGDAVKELRGPHTMVSVCRSKFIKKTVNELIVAADSASGDDIRQELRAPDFAVSKRQKVSRLDAVRMQASGCPHVYRLDLPGREFLASANASVNTELDAAGVYEPPRRSEY